MLLRTAIRCAYDLFVSVVGCCRTSPYVSFLCLTIPLVATLKPRCSDLSLLCENEKAFYDLPDPTTHFPSAAKFTRVEQNLVFRKWIAPLLSLFCVPILVSHCAHFVLPNINTFSTHLETSLRHNLAYLSKAGGYNTTGVS